MFRQKNFLLMCLAVICMTVACFGKVSAQSSPIRYETDIYDGDESADFEEENLKLADESKHLTGAGVTMIGDSIMNGNRKIILGQLPDAYIDAKGSRDICGGFEAAQKLQAEGKLSDVVIVELGTNGSLVNPGYYSTGMQNMLELLGTERQIFWVTVYCSYSQYMAANNKYIWELANTRRNIIVIDWYSLAVQNPEWFPDGVHPNTEGARQFAKLLQESLEARYGIGNNVE